MKRIIDFIFEDVPEDETEKKVVAEGPVMRHSFKENKPEVKHETKAEVKTQNVVNKPVENKEVVKETKKEEPVKKQNFGIDLNENREKVAKTNKDVMPTKKPTEYPKNDIKYESQPAISPIFGVIDSYDEKPVYKTSNIVGSSTTAANDSKIGTILSPIYGTLEHIQNNDKYNEVESFPEVTKISDVKENKNETVEKQEVFEEENKYADKNLDDVIVKPKDETYILPEEISLFDDLD